MPNRAALKRRAEAGEWLLVQQVADLFGVSRATVDRLIDAGTIETRNPYRSLLRCNPDHVLRELARREP